MLTLFALPEPVGRAVDWIAEKLSASGLGDLVGAGDLGTTFKGLAMSDDPVVLGGLVVLALCAFGVAWALLLVVARGIVGLFGGGRRPRGETRDHHSQMDRMAATAASVPAEARLDTPVHVRREESRRSMAVATVPADDAPRASRLSSAVGGPTPPRPAFGQMAPALPTPTGPKALPFRQISMAQKPRLMALGAVGSARPELMGRATPASFRDSGAVEQCHIATKQPCAGGAPDTVREKEFTLFSVPRVDTDGRKQPDVTVFTVADHGIVQRGVEWPAPKRSRRD